MRVVAIAAIFLVTTLAGCADSSDAPPADPAQDVAWTLADLSSKVHDILPVEEIWLDMDDGKGMHQAIYRPDTDEPVPVFINFSPYWGDTAETAGDAFSNYMIQEYVPRGYAVVLSAIRGTGHSEGCFSIGGDRELMDLHETVDHFANVDWSNGNVATGGKSYDSTPTNGLIAKFPHPALKGVFHVSGITDMYEYNYHDGVPYATGPIFNTYYYAQGTDEYGVSLVGAGSPENEDPESLVRLIDDVACTDLPFVQAHGIGSGVTGMKTDYWIERDWARFIGDSEWNGSIFFVHGLQDWNVKPDHILPWIDNLPEQIRVKGWLHQAGHVYPERQDWNLTMLRWMDAELKGIDTGIWDEPAWDVRSDDDQWYQHSAWPAPLQPINGSTTSGPLGTNDLGWQMPVENTTHLSGAVHLDMDVAYSSNPAAVVSATLYDSRNGERTWVSEGFMKPVYRNGLDAPAVDAPIGFYPLTLVMYPADHVFQTGSTIEIVLQEAPRNGIVADAQLDMVNSIDLGDVWLPLATADLMLDQPRDMECFAC